MFAELAAKFLPRQLRQQLALLTSLVLLLTIFVYAGYSADEQAQFAQKRAELEVVALAQNIAVSSSDAMIIKDFAGMENLLVRMVGLPNIQEARITDPRGRLLSHVVSKPGAKPEVRFGSRPIDAPAAANAATRIDYSQPASGWRYQLGLADPRRMVVWQPIFSGTLLGWVVVDHDLTSTAEIRKHIWLDSLSAGAIALIANLWLLLLFLKRPMGALQTATNFATRLDQSHGAQLPVFHGSSEIKSLTTALNRVSTSLFTQDTVLNQQNIVVAARTADLYSSEKYLQTIVDAALDAVIGMNEQGLVTEWNPEAERIFGYSRADAVGKLLESLIVPPPMREAHRNGIKHFLKTGVGPLLAKRIEVTAMRAGGGEFPVEMAIVAIRSGEAVFFNTFLRDITERKQAEAALQESEARYRTLAEWSPEPISVHRDGKIIYVNPASIRMLGASSAQQLLGRTVFSFLHPDSHEIARTRAQEVIDSGRDASPVMLKLVKLDGSIIDVESQGVKILFDGQPAFHSAQRDVTGRNAAEAARASLEAQLRESQKMQAIGTLAGGIAHDFNNIIATILGNAELARQDAEPDPLVLESLEEIRKAGSRARDLVQQILSFSRREPARRSLMALAPVIEDAVRLLRATLPARIALVLQCDAGVPAVLADKTQIEQVLINLATNAMQAMRDAPGRIDIRLDCAAVDAAMKTAHPVLRDLRLNPRRQAVRLTVRDSGPGMDSATLAHIFEPFFTTKQVGEGTGLGLSVVHGIVQAHEGAMVVESTPGNGSSFAIYLPPAVVAPP